MSILIPVSNLGMTYNKTMLGKAFFIQCGKGAYHHLEHLNEAAAGLVDTGVTKYIVLMLDAAVKLKVPKDDLLTLVDVMSSQAPVYIYSYLPKENPLNKFLMDDTSCDFIHVLDDEEHVYKREWKADIDIHKGVMDVYDVWVEVTPHEKTL